MALPHPVCYWPFSSILLAFRCLHTSCQKYLLNTGEFAVQGLNLFSAGEFSVSVLNFKFFTAGKFVGVYIFACLCHFLVPDFYLLIVCPDLHFLFSGPTLTLSSFTGLVPYPWPGLVQSVWVLRLNRATGQKFPFMTGPEHICILSHKLSSTRQGY